MAGEAVAACKVKLKKGLPAGVKLVLRSRRPRRRVPLKLDPGDGYVFANRHKHYPPWQKLVVATLRRARGLSLVLEHGRSQVVVARFRPGYVQYFSTGVAHDPTGGGVTVSTYIFFGSGLTVGPAQLEEAIYSTKKRRGRRVVRRFSKKDCSSRKRCSVPRTAPFFAKPQKSSTRGKGAVAGKEK